jgi:regulator of protease activity HflC (stomatin/prohibitin superfamily)
MLLEILQFITGVFVLVYDGQHALKFTLGRAGNVVGPGIHWKWPIIQRYRIVDTKDTTIELEPQTIQLQDDLVYEVGARAVYQVTNLRKALIEVDNLVIGLKNRIVLSVQRVVKAQDRQSIRDLGQMIAAVKRELQPVEEQWGVKFHEFGFSTISPTPETLEITQLRKLAQEKLALYQQFRSDAGLSEEAAVALVSGAVMAVHTSQAAAREKQLEQLPLAKPTEKPAAAPDAASPEGPPADGHAEGGGLERSH